MTFKEFLKKFNYDTISKIPLYNLLELFYDEGYKQGWKNGVKASPISDIWNDEEDGVWEKLYNKQKDESNKKA